MPFNGSWWIIAEYIVWPNRRTAIYLSIICAAKEIPEHVSRWNVLTDKMCSVDFINERFL